MNLFQPNECTHSRDTSKSTDYLFPTTEPVPGEKPRMRAFASSLMAKFAEICDEVREIHLHLAFHCF